MKFYLAFFVIGILFASTGIRALLKPAPYHHGKDDSSPFYESKAAIKNETVWNKAQKWYGQYMTAMSIVYILLSFILHPLYQYVLTNLWKHESHNIPFFVTVLLPFMILLGLTYVCIELRIRNYIKKSEE